MSHVFISYAHADGDFASVTRAEIEKSGFSTWSDDDIEPGDTWSQSIDLAISSAFAIVVVVSPDSMESKYVTYEWSFGLGLGIKVVPILLSPCSPHPKIIELQYIDFTNRAARPWEKLKNKLDNALRDSKLFPIRITQNAPLAIRSAVRSLSSYNSDARALAMETLVHLAQTDDTEALSVLEQCLRHPGFEVRLPAAFTLARKSNYKDVRCIPVLSEAMRIINSRISEIAGDMLIQFGTSAISELGNVLQDDDWRNRSHALDALQAIGTSEVVPYLAEALNDNDPHINAKAYEALKRIGTPDAVAILEARRNAQDGEAQNVGE